MDQQHERVDLHLLIDDKDALRREIEMRMKDLCPPKFSQSAYDLFVIDERSKLEAINPNYPMADMAKEIAKLWKDADLETKAKYERLAELDGARYLREYNSYIETLKSYELGLEYADCNGCCDDLEVETVYVEEKPYDPETAGQDDWIDWHRVNREPDVAPVCKNKPRKRDPNMPKRPLSAFFWFTNEERSKVKASYPDYSLGEISKELAKRWTDADPETKAKFERVAEEDRKRYEKELEIVKKYLNVDEDSDFEPKNKDDDFHGDVGGPSTSNR